jgi:hypothetical protein
MITGSPLEDKRLEVIVFGIALFAIALREPTLGRGKPSRLDPVPSTPGVHPVLPDETRAHVITEAKALAKAFIEGGGEIIDK